MKRLIGFTLVEIIVVIAILGVLAALLSPVFSSAIGEARKQPEIAGLGQVAKAIEIYRTDNDQYFPPRLKSLIDVGVINEDRELYDKRTGKDARILHSIVSGFSFYYPLSYAQLQVEVCLPELIVEFQEGQNSIIKDMEWHNFNCGLGSGQCKAQSHEFGKKLYTYSIPNPTDHPVKYKVRGVNAQGSVRWFDSTEKWELDHIFKTEQSNEK